MKKNRTNLRSVGLLALAATLYWAGCAPPPQPFPIESEPLRQGEVGTFRDASFLMHGIFGFATFSRDSEAGHPNFNADLAGEPMAAQARLWMELLGETERTFFEDGRFFVQPRRDGEDGREEAGLREYPHGVYVYHMHHRAGRFADHDLEDAITHAGLHYMVQPGVHLLQNHFRDGRFHHHPEDDSFDKASMAHGMAALQGHVYAWVRWAKPDGSDDMGRLSREDLTRWMVYDPEALVDQFARPAAVVLREAWDAERGIYDFDGDPVWSLEEIGSLLRGLKSVYEPLYMFGTSEDRRTALELARHAAEVLEEVLTVAQPWGLPDAVEFTPAGADPASKLVRSEALWGFVNDFGGGFAIFAEAEGTSSFVDYGPLGPLREKVNGYLDQWMEHATARTGLDGFFATSYRYDDGSVVDGVPRIAPVGIMVTAIINHYQWGGRFVQASEWGDVDGGTAARSEELYSFLRRHQQALQEVAERWLADRR